MIDMEEINRDPWPTYPVNKDDLRKVRDRMVDLILRVEDLEAALLQIIEAPPSANPQDIARKALRGMK
jgi:hypothetical protein